MIHYTIDIDYIMKISFTKIDSGLLPRQTLPRARSVHVNVNAGFVLTAAAATMRCVENRFENRSFENGKQKICQDRLWTKTFERLKRKGGANYRGRTAALAGVIDARWPRSPAALATHSCRPSS